MAELADRKYWFKWPHNHHGR